MRLWPVRLLLLLSSPWLLLGESGERPGSLAVLLGDGRSQDIAALQGEVVLLDFMTTTCPSCRAASSGIERLHARYAKQGLRVFGIVLNTDRPGDWQEYAKANGLTFALGTVDRAKVAGYLRHPADKAFLVPTLALIGRDGQFRLVETGWNVETDLERKISALLREARPRKDGKK
jgi:peroxiredoxin